MRQGLHEALVVLKLTHPFAFVSQVLGLKVHVTMPSPTIKCFDFRAHNCSKLLANVVFQLCNFPSGKIDLLSLLLGLKPDE